MNRIIPKIASFTLLGACLSVTACSSSGDLGANVRGGVRIETSIQPQIATWRCTDGVTMTVRRQGANLLVSDTRGIETELPADPLGQRERYGKTGFALVFAGRTASWFASGHAPADCRR